MQGRKGDRDFAIIISGFFEATARFFSHEVRTISINELSGANLSLIAREKNCTNVKKRNNYMQKRKYAENAMLTETSCKLIKEITTGNDRKIPWNSQSTENTGTVRLSVSRILVRDLRRHLSWEYRSQVEVSAVTFLALNINRTKKSQELPARFSPRRRLLVLCQKIVRRIENTVRIMAPRSWSRANE